MPLTRESQESASRWGGGGSVRLRQGGQDGSARRKADDSFSKRGGWRDVTRDVLLIDSPSRAKSPHSVEKHDDPRESDGGRGNPTLSQGIHPSKAKDDNGRHKSRREEAHLPQSKRFERGSDSGNSQIVNQRGILGKEAGGVQLADLTRTQSLSHEADNLVERRLRQAYGFGISDKEVRYIARMQAKIANSKGSNGQQKPIVPRSILGKNCSAIKGQIVKHVERGKHVASQCDRDYLSGGEEGVIMDVCGDYAQVRWTNGNIRFYFIGDTPMRKDPNGNDTDNPRALRCLEFVNKM